jgi:hypothetical protein
MIIMDSVGGQLMQRDIGTGINRLATMPPTVAGTAVTDACDSQTARLLDRLTYAHTVLNSINSEKEVMEHINSITHDGARLGLVQLIRMANESVDLLAMRLERLAGIVGRV